MSAQVEWVYSAVLRWNGAQLRVMEPGQVMEPGAERALITFADNTDTAVSLLRKQYICRMNVSDRVLADIRTRLRGE